MTTLQSPPNQSPDTSGRTTWWVLGGVLSAVTLLLAVMIAGALIWAASTPEETATHRQTYPAPVTGVDLHVSVGQVHLAPATGTDLEVRREMTWKGTGPDVTEQRLADGTFEARADCDEDLLSWFGPDECKVEYSVALPAGADATVGSAVADIHVDGVDGSLDLQSSVGNINAENLRTTGTTVQADVGDVRLAFDEVLGDIEVDTSVGNVVILLPDDGAAYDVRFETSVGTDNIDVATDPSADHVITVSSSVGDLTVRYAS